MCLQVKELSPNEFPKAQAFYASVNYEQKIVDSDKVVAAFENGLIVGVGRVSVEEGVLVLRGMHVNRSMLGRGIGRELLYGLDRIIGKRECFCIPHDWLEYFYSIIGFKKIGSENAPLFIQERMKSYKERFPQLIVMKK